MMKKISFFFFIAAFLKASPAQCLKVLDVKVGSKGNTTRIFLKFDKPYSPEIPASNAKSLNLKFPSGTTFAPKSKEKVNHGLVGEYAYFPKMYLLLFSLSAPAKVTGSKRLEHNGSYGYLIDLQPQSNHEKLHDVDKNPLYGFHKSETQKPDIDDSTGAQAFSIEPSQNETFVTFTFFKKPYIKVIKNEIANEIIFLIPKTNWSAVKKNTVQGGAIDNLVVDQGSSSYTKIIMDVLPGTKLLKKSPLNAGSGLYEYQFTLQNPPEKEKKVCKAIKDADLFKDVHLPKNMKIKKCKKCPLPAEVCPHPPKGGVYFGMGLGYGFGLTKIKFSSPSFTFPGSSTPKIATSHKINDGILAEGILGIESSKEAFYFGLEGRAAYQNMQNNNYEPAAAFVDHNVQSGTNFGVLYKNIRQIMKFQFQGSGLFGYHTSAFNTIYGRVGYGFQAFEQRLNAQAFSEATGFPADFRETIKGIVLGIGIDSAVSSNFSVRFDYQHLIGKTQKVSGDNWFSELFGRAEFTQKSVNGTMKFNYAKATLDFIYRLNTKPVYSVNANGLETGFYTGLDVGSNSFENIRTPYGTAGQFFIHSQDTSSLSIAAGGHIGINFVSGNLYLGVESQYLFRKSRFKFIDEMHAETVLFNNTLKNAWHNTIRPGFKVNPQAAIYGIFGHTNTFFSHNISNRNINPFTAYSPHEKSLNGIVYGFGLKIQGDQKTALRIDFIREQYKSMTITGVDVIETLKPTSNMILLGFVKSFEN